MIYAPGGKAEVYKVVLISCYLATSSNKVQNQFVYHFVLKIFANEPSVAELVKAFLLVSWT